MTPKEIDCLWCSMCIIYILGWFLLLKSVY